MFKTLGAIRKQYRRFKIWRKGCAVNRWLREHRIEMAEQERSQERVNMINIRILSSTRELSAMRLLK